MKQSNIVKLENILTKAIDINKIGKYCYHRTFGFGIKDLILSLKQLYTYS